VIESHAFVLLPPFKFVIPECPERPVGCNFRMASVQP
jgi:hypothetical protein